MANNMVVGPQAVVSKSNVSFETAGITPENCAIIYKAKTGASYVPGRSINGITSFEMDEGYYIVMLEVADLSANLIPPVTTTSNPTFFLDNFVGSSGAYSTHTPDVGAATNPLTGGLVAVNLNGSGQAVFGTGGYAKIVPTGTLPTDIEITAVITSLPASPNSLILSLFDDGTDYVQVGLTGADGDSNFGLQIVDSLGAHSFTALPLTYPITLKAKRVGKVITAQAAATVITYTGLANGPIAEIVTSNGATLESVSVLAV